MTDMGQADRTLRQNPVNTDEGVFDRHRERMRRYEMETNWKELYEAERKRAEGLEMDLIYYKNRYEVLQGEVNHYQNMQAQQDLIANLFNKGEVK